MDELGVGRETKEEEESDESSEEESEDTIEIMKEPMDEE